jgi:hypothetical protein
MRCNLVSLLTLFTHLFPVLSLVGNPGEPGRHHEAMGVPPDPGFPIGSEAVAGSESFSNVYVVPYYPLPPTPTQSPPVTMPFAYIDWEHENAFTPPALTVQSESESGLEAGSEAPLGSAGEAASEAGDVLPFEAPPMSESETGIKHVWRQHAGSGDNRLDSVNPYCQYCQAFMATVMGGGADVDAACGSFPKTSQVTCKLVGKTLEMKDQAIVILEKGCIDRTGEMAQIKGQKECPPLVACNLMEADNGAPMCGMVKGTWGEFRHVYNANGQLINEQTKDGNIRTGAESIQKRGDGVDDVDSSGNVVFSPPPALNVIPGASNPYCDLCQTIMNVLQKTPESTVHDTCKLVPASLYTDCMFVSKSLKQNPDALKIIESGCKDHTGKTIEEAKPCPGEIGCNLIVDATGGPMCGSYPGQWGSVEGAVEGLGASSLPDPGSEGGSEGGRRRFRLLR